MKWGIIQEKFYKPLSTIQLRSNTVHVQICNMFTLNMQHGICLNHVGIQNFLKNYKKTWKSFVLWMLSLGTFQLFFIPIHLGAILQFHQKLHFTWHQVKYCRNWTFVRKLHEIWYKRLTGHVGSFQKIFKLISYHSNSKLDRSLFWTENLQYITRSF